MRKLINRILVRLGLRKPIDLSNTVLRLPDGWSEGLEGQFSTIGWKWYGGYGRMNNKDFIVRGEIVENE